MPAKNNNVRSGHAGDRRRRDDRPEYSRGNRNWNTEGYKESIRTAHTDTKIMKSPSEAVRSGASYYYDNTAAAIRERRMKRFEERRESWRRAVKKNRRHRLALRRLLSFIIIAGTVLAASAMVYKLFFIASDITVVGESTYTADEIVKAAGLDTRKNLFSFSSRVAGNSIRFYCPRVSNTEFDRTIPNKVEITVEEEAPIYCAEIYGDVYGISNSLRVLDKLGAEETEGLIKLKLQTVSYAVSGSEIELSSDRADSFLREATRLLDASFLKQRLTQIDLRNDFDIVMVADNKYKLVFGTQDDFEIKIRLAAALLDDEMFKSGSKAIINLEDTTKTSVIIDNQLVFD